MNDDNDRKLSLLKRINQLTGDAAWWLAEAARVELSDPQYSIACVNKAASLRLQAERLRKEYDELH